MGLYCFWAVYLKESCGATCTHPFAILALWLHYSYVNLNVLLFYWFLCWTEQRPSLLPYPFILCIYHHRTCSSILSDTYPKRKKPILPSLLFRVIAFSHALYKFNGELLYCLTTTRLHWAVIKWVNSDPLACQGFLGPHNWSLCQTHWHFHMCLVWLVWFVLCNTEYPTMPQLVKILYGI